MAARRLRCLVGVLAAVTSGSCGGLEELPPSAAPRPAIWVRDVAPFEVRDASGAPYSLPFLGGFNAPRPQLLDLDGDGDLDLVVQEVTGRLLVFDGELGPDGMRWSWRPEALSDVDVGEWYRFVDADGDGAWDLLTESPFNYLRLYRNHGEPGELRLELAWDTLRDSRGAPIFSDRQNIPWAGDLDCNGLLDLLVGRLVGTVTRFEATAPLGAGTPVFRLVTDRFEGIEIVGDPAAQPPAPPGPGAPGGVPGPFSLPPGPSPRGLRAPEAPARHGANTMALADVDGDGDLDLLWGDFFEPGLLLIENTGTCEAPNLRNSPIPFPVEAPVRTSGYNAATFGDLNGNGALDLLVGVLGGAYNPTSSGAENLLHLAQEPGGGFQQVTSRFLRQIDVGTESVASLVDLDGDGDLDLLVANRIDPVEQETARLYLFRNVGTRQDPVFEEEGPLDLSGAYHMAPAFGDFDGDGDFDLLLGSFGAELAYFENVGSPTVPRFELVDSAAAVLPRGSNATPTLGDIDGDGKLELLVGQALGTVSLFRDVGTTGRPRFELVADDYLGIRLDRRSFPVLVDWDMDGDLDLVVGTEGSGLVYFENRGTPSSPDFVPAPNPFPDRADLPALATPAFGDLDGDAELELVAGGAGGGVTYYDRRPASDSAEVPPPP